MNHFPTIVTVTFSPCIDKSTSVSCLIPEKKLRCTAPGLEPGGGGINVARAIKKLGGEAIAVYPAGGYTGKFFNQLVVSEKISPVIIEMAEETRENIIILDESTQQQYRFGLPGSPMQEKEWQQVIDRVQEIEEPAFIVVSGSLPPGVPDDILARLSHIARKKNSKFIADVPGNALQLAIKEGVYLIKPNLGELSALAGKDHLLSAEIPVVARKLIADGNCEVVVVSMGPSGALLVTKDFTKAISAPTVKRRSTVGAGDSMVAGIIYFLATGKALEQAVQFGVACGTAAAMNPGTQLCKKGDAEDLFNIIVESDNMRSDFKYLSV